MRVKHICGAEQNVRMHAKNCVVVLLCVLLFSAGAIGQAPPGQSATPSNDDPEVQPAVSKLDVKIVERAAGILNSPAKWNRADNRECPSGAKTFSLYCALEQATNEVTGKFEHRGAAMQEARFVVDEVAANRKNYEHRLMDYNNDPTTSFADIQKVLRLVRARIVKRLKEQSEAPTK
jgi:hypothetical protein